MEFDPRIFFTTYLGTYEFMFIKEQQGRGVDYSQVVKLTKFDEKHVTCIYGSCDYKDYKQNFIVNEFYFTKI